MKVIPLSEFSEHICKENEMHGTAGENKVYFNEEKWYLSTDCGCCHVKINHCPFCGIELRSDSH